MYEELNEARIFIETQYKSRLNQTLQSKLGHFKEWHDPIWEWHDENLMPLESGSDSFGAVIADPEIGVCLFLQKYSPLAPVTSQIKKALQYRSSMLPGRTKESELKDQLGEWSVVLYFFCEKEDVDSWISEISFLRQETAYFEEVPVDAVINFDGDWRKTIEKHKFPRLLFNVREAIRINSLEESIDWASADKVIEQEIRQLPYQIDDQQELSFVHQTLLELDRLKSRLLIEDDQPAESPLHLRCIQIENFRNIEKLTINLSSESDQVSSHVFQGPNGSGKSSIVEALSFATFGFSSRYLEYMNDKNVRPGKKSDKYISDYLRPMSGEDGSTPKLSINDSDLMDVIVPESGEENLDRRTINATILSQSAGSGFTSISARDLGEEVAGSYTSIATDLHSYVTSELKKAENHRANFNVMWGISIKISRSTSAHGRILGKIIKDKFQVYRSPINWLQNTSYSQFPRFHQISELRDTWSSWSDEYESKLEKPGIKNLAKGREFLSKIGDEYRDLLISTITAIRGLRDSLPELNEELRGDIGKYATWLSEDYNSNDTGKVEVDSLQYKDELERLNNAISVKGANRKKAKDRVMHLDRAMDFLKVDWVHTNDDICPTCESNLVGRGGAKQVIESLHKTNLQELNDIEGVYSEAVLQKEHLEKTINELGLTICPITNESIQNIEKLVSEFLMLTGDVGTLLLDDNLRSSVAVLITWLQDIPQVYDLEKEVEEVNNIVGDAKEIYTKAMNEFDAVSSAPTKWKSIEKKVLNAQSKAVMEHLPKTVQSLWRELAQNLTSALWQHPASAEFEMHSNRGVPSARVMLEGSKSLAAHILNGAEVQNLGLAWFFARYLTFGRFHTAFLILDNPAQHMDQPTYRDLCRLLESLLRLHRSHRQPLTMLTFFHQDTRALDAARATNGTLHLLRWNKKGTPVIEESIRLLQDEHPAPFPAKVLALG